MHLRHQAIQFSSHIHLMPFLQTGRFIILAKNTALPSSRIGIDQPTCIVFQYLESVAYAVRQFRGARMGAEMTNAKKHLGQSRFREPIRCGEEGNDCEDSQGYQNYALKKSKNCTG